MAIGYSTLVTTICMLILWCGNKEYGIEGLLFVGFAITFLMLSILRWEIYNMNKKIK